MSGKNLLLSLSPPPFAIQIFSAPGGRFAGVPSALVICPYQRVHSHQEVLVVFHSFRITPFFLRGYYIFSYFFFEKRKMVRIIDI